MHNWVPWDGRILAKNWLINILSLSLIIFLGIQWRCKSFLTKTWATKNVVYGCDKATKWAYLDSWSNTIIVTEFPVWVTEPFNEVHRDGRLDKIGIGLMVGEVGLTMLHAWHIDRLEASFLLNQRPFIGVCKCEECRNGLLLGSHGIQKVLSQCVERLLANILALGSG